MIVPKNKTESSDSIVFLPYEVTFFIQWYLPNDEFLSLPFPGEYITLYQTQRNALKSYYKDRERMIAQLSSEKANMQVSVFIYLNPLCLNMECVNLLFHFHLIL